MTMHEKSTKGRKGNAPIISPLAGKLFDETGDRLTRSHTQKNGKRLRYYLSRRLVTDRRRNHADVWRLTAREIATGIAGVLHVYLMNPAVLTELNDKVTASEISDLQARLQHIALDFDPDRGAISSPPDAGTKPSARARRSASSQSEKRPRPAAFSR